MVRWFGGRVGLGGGRIGLDGGVIRVAHFAHTAIPALQRGLPMREDAILVRFVLGPALRSSGHVPASSLGIVGGVGLGK